MQMRVWWRRRRRRRRMVVISDRCKGEEWRRRRWRMKKMKTTSMCFCWYSFSTSSFKIVAHSQEVSNFPLSNCNWEEVSVPLSIIFRLLSRGDPFHLSRFDTIVAFFILFNYSTCVLPSHRSLFLFFLEVLR